MQTIASHMNTAAAVVVEGQKTMQKDTARGGRKAMVWLLIGVLGFSILVKIFDSVLFGEDQNGVGEICLFAAFVIGIAWSRLKGSWHGKSAKLTQPNRRQEKCGAESPQTDSATAKATSETQSSPKSAVKARKPNPQAQRGNSNGASAGISGTCASGSPLSHPSSVQRRGNNANRGAGHGGHSTAAEPWTRCNFTSIEAMQDTLDSGSEIDAGSLAHGIAACCEAGNLDLAEKWLGHLLHLAPSALKMLPAWQVHMVVEAGIKAGAVRKVAAWLGQMHAAGLQSHAKTLLAVLEALVSIKEVAQAEQVLSRMEAADAQVDTACYQLLFEHCVPVESTENIARAEMWLQRIGRKGNADLSQGYAAIIRARGAIAAAKDGVDTANNQAEFWMMHAIAAGITRSTQCYNAVIHAFAKMGDFEKAELWLERLEKVAKEAAEEPGSRFALDVYSYSAIMDAYAQRGESTRAEACFARMKAAGVKPDAVSFNTVVKAHARSGNISGAEQWLCRARRHSVQVDAYGYNAVIAAAARGGDPATAERWLCRMHEDGACPDVVSYNSVINAWAKRCDAARAQRLIDMMCENSVEPDVVSLGAAVHACAKAGDMLRAEHIFERIVARGIARPDAICYNAMIDAFVKVRETRKAEEWLSKMIRDGVTPSVVSFTTVLHAHARSGDIEAAEQGLERMLADGIEANVVSYSALIHACVKAGDIDRAEKWFERMRATGIQANVVSYSVLLNVCAKAGDVPRAERWLEDMCSAGIQPNVVCYNNVIDACAKAGRGERAEAWLRRLIEASHAQKLEGHTQGVSAGNGRALRGSDYGSKEAKVTVPDQELAPTRQSYTTAAQAYATHGLWCDVERIFTEMEDAGLSTDEFSLTVVLSAYSRARPRQRERAELAFRRHVARNLPLTKPPLRVLRSAIGAHRYEQLCADLRVNVSL